MIKTFVKRFYLSCVISVLFMGCGALSLSSLPLNIEANNAKNIVTIVANSKNPTTVNGMNKYSNSLEKNLKKLKGIKSLTSYIDSHRIELEVFFEQDQSLVDKLKEVGNVIVTTKRPEYVKVPTVQQSSKGDLPLMIINTYSDSLSLNEITRYAKEVISGKLYKINGISYFEIKGEPKPEIQIKIIKERVSFYNINIDKIRRTFDILGQEKGFVARETNMNQFNVLGTPAIKSLDDVKNVIVDTERMIKVSDIADVTFAPKDFLSEQWINGDRRVLSIKVFKTNEGNPLETSDEIMKVINQWKEKHNLVLDIEDNAAQIRKFFQKTKKTFIEAVVIVLVIIFVFLGSFKASLTPILAIPVSLIAACFPMKLTGCSVNVPTLMGALIAIGLVVDDAILVVENITQHYTKHKNLKKAVVEGTEEIQTSIIVMTLTLACVFFPAIMSKGAFGATLKEFAITISTAVIFSGILSLTLTPSICARFFGYSHFVDKIMKPIESFYSSLLKIVFGFKYVFVAFAVFSIVSSGMMLKRLPRESVPSVQKREININSINSGNKHLRFFKKQSSKIAEYLKQHPEVKSFAIYMSSYISIDIRLHENSTTPILDIQNEILNFMDKEIKDIQFVTKNKKSDTNFDVFVYGNLTDDEIRSLGAEYINRVRYSPLVNNAIQYSNDKIGYNLKINYQKAAAINCDIDTIEKVVNILNTRYFVADLENSGKKYKIITLTDKNETLEDLLQNVWNERRQNQTVRISPSVFAEIVQQKQIDSISKYNGLSSFKFELSAKPGVRMGDLINELSTLHEKTIGNKTELAFTGKAQEFLDDKNEMQRMFLLSSVFIFLILLAQFESLRATLIVLITAPLAIWGSLLVITSNGSLNIYSTTAMMTLIGLITKHGILFVNTSEELRSQGKSKYEAAYEAGVSRLRPVLMTTLAMALGIAPLLFETEPSMINLFTMAQVLVPGLLIGTLMTLFVVPCLCLF